MMLTPDRIDLSALAIPPGMEAYFEEKDGQTWFLASRSGFFAQPMSDLDPWLAVAALALLALGWDREAAINLGKAKPQLERGPENESYVSYANANAYRQSQVSRHNADAARAKAAEILELLKGHTDET